MKKSIIFLINGLGVEKPGSYSIAIDQCMPKLCRLKETSYYTTAIINSVEYRSAYEQFFLGDTYKLELDYIKNNILNENVLNNEVFKSIKNNLSIENSKFHVFIEPTSSQIVEQINDLVTLLGTNKQVYLHLILTQQTTSEYNQLKSIISYIKYHLNTNVTVGFVIGKEAYTDELTKDQMDYLKKMFFLCSVERWSDTDKKLTSLTEEGTRPCLVSGFCATNECTIANNDTIMFFNTRRTTYDKFIRVIYENASFFLKNENISLPLYSLVKLDTKYQINSIAESIEYNNSLAAILNRANKKALIATSAEHLQLVNFLANGLNYQSNPNIQFVKIEDTFSYTKENLISIIDNSPFELIIFDYHMDVSKTINYLKEQLEKIDNILGMIGEISENKHSLFITSLYGLKKELPLADYNSEMVTLDYEMEIPIFFYDYTYPKSKYTLAPGETNDILQTAIKCIWDSEDLYSLIRLKGLLNNLFGKK